MLVTYIASRFELVGIPFAVLFVAGILLCMVVPYLFGSLNFAIIISRLFYRDDIRKYGSGNAGTTNMLRTYGKLPAAATLLLDMSKGALSVLFGFAILGNLMGYGGMYVAGLFAVLGHMFPCFYRFRGGKGVATTAMVVLCTDPLLFLILLVIFVIIVAGSKMISLGSIMCMLLYPVFMGSLVMGTKPAGVLISFFIAGLVVFMHRGNIVRIWQGKENRLSFRKHEKTPAQPEEIEEILDEAKEPQGDRPDPNTSRKKLKNRKNHR